VRRELPDWLLAAYVALSALVLLWDVLLAGQIARARRQSRAFVSLTAVCGLFIVPGALIAVASGMILTGRAIHLVAWMWPVVLLFYVLQSGYALFRRHVTALFAAPIWVYNVALLLAAIARYAGQWVADLPSLLQGAEVAQVGALGFLFGRGALDSPWLLLLPLLSPAYPARWRVSMSVRVVLAVAATVVVTLTGMQYPGAVHAAQSFSTFGSVQMQERPRGDFALGLRVMPTLEGPPPPLAIERDLALADTLGVAIVAVTIVPEGVRALILDSLAASLEDIRRDSVRLVISLGYSRNEASEFAQRPSQVLARRLQMVDQVVRRLRPDVLVPALDPMDAGVRALGPVPALWWRDYLTRAAALAHRLRPRTRVALAASTFSAADSALYAWGSQAGGIDLLGFSFAPSFSGGTSLATRLRLAERWMRTSAKEHWVFSARGFPRTFGEANHERGLWGVVAWATNQPRVTAVVIDAAGDYDAQVGLRAPGGRLRPAVSTLIRVSRALAETAEGR